MSDCQIGICQSGTNLAAVRLANLGFAAGGAPKGKFLCWVSCAVLLQNPDWVKRQIARLVLFPDWPDCNYFQIDQIVRISRLVRKYHPPDWLFFQIDQLAIISRLTRLCEFPDWFENNIRLNNDLYLV